MRGRLSQVIAAVAIAMALGVTQSATPAIGRSAPSFEMTTIGGERISLDDYRGKVVVINFWATWCGPCKQELPLLDAYYRAQEKVGLRVVAVTTEDSVPPMQLRKLAAVLSIKMARRFKGGYAPMTGLPTNYVIDRAGVLRYAASGAFTLDYLNELLVPLLREPAPANPVVATR